MQDVLPAEDVISNCIRTVNLLVNLVPAMKENIALESCEKSTLYFD